MATGLPYWMPPELGDDLNDYWLKYGVSALAREIKELRYEA